MANFAVDEASRHERASILTKGAEEIRGLVEQIYKGIDDLKNAWTGESYDSFNEMCYSYQPALEALSEMLDAFSKIIGEQVDGPQETLSTNLQKVLGL